MRIDHLSDLPEWDDNKFKDTEDGDEWKPNPIRDACKALYQKWKEIMMMLNGILQNDQPVEGHEASYLASVKQMILGDAYEVAAKIRSSETGGLYVLRMENAAIIRKNAQFVASSLLTLGVEDGTDEQYVTLLRAEIDQFRDLFKVWVNSFEKDEYTDDWGLFV